MVTEETLGEKIVKGGVKNDVCPCWHVWLRIVFVHLTTLRKITNYKVASDMSALEE